VLIRPNQADTTKGKNVIIGKERPEQRKGKKVLLEKTPGGASTLRGQDKCKCTGSNRTGLTGLHRENMAVQRKKLGRPLMSFWKNTGG